MPNFVAIGLTIVEISWFWIFQEGGCRHLGFLKFLRKVKRFELHRRAKYRQNRLNRGRDMVIFRFFKMAAAAILDFWNFKFLTVGTVKRLELHPRAKFSQNRSKPGSKRNQWRQLQLTSVRRTGRCHVRNSPSPAMQPFVKLLWPPVIVTVIIIARNWKKEKSDEMRSPWRWRLRVWWRPVRRCQAQRRWRCKVEKDRTSTPHLRILLLLSPQPSQNTQSTPLCSASVCGHSISFTGFRPSVVLEDKVFSL